MAWPSSLYGTWTLYHIVVVLPVNVYVGHSLVPTTEGPSVFLAIDHRHHGISQGKSYIHCEGPFDEPFDHSCKLWTLSTMCQAFAPTGVKGFIPQLDQHERGREPWSFGLVGQDLYWSTSWHLSWFALDPRKMMKCNDLGMKLRTYELIANKRHINFEWDKFREFKECIEEFEKKTKESKVHVEELKILRNNALK